MARPPDRRPPAPPTTRPPERLIDRPSNKPSRPRGLDARARNSIGEQGVHALTERFQQEHKRCLWNAKQLTSSIDQVILTENPIPSGLAASTQARMRSDGVLLESSGEIITWDSF